MHTDQLRQKDFIAALFSQDNQQPSPDPDFFNGPSFQNTQNIPGPLPPSDEQNFTMQNNGNSNLLWEQQLKIQQLQQLQQLQQQIFQQQVRHLRVSKSRPYSRGLRRWKY